MNNCDEEKTIISLFFDEKQAVYLPFEKMELHVAQMKWIGFSVTLIIATI